MSLKYEPAKIETFIDMYVTGLYTLQAMCMQSGFSVTTYYHWKKNNPEFQSRLEEADRDRINGIKEIATRGLIRLIEGGTYEEIHEEFERPEIHLPPKYPYLSEDDPLNVEARQEQIARLKVEPVLIRRRVSKKVLMPNAASVQFALRNVDKENFPDLQKQEINDTRTTPVPVILVRPDSVKTHFPSDLEPPADDITNTDESV